MIRHFLFLTLLLCGQLAFGQREYRPGYIVKPAGDTLRGLIRYVEGYQQSVSCCYRADEKQPVICYQPDELKGYGFIEGRIYRSVLLNESRIFMQLLADGNATLLKNSVRFYVQKGAEPLQELLSLDTTVYRSGRPYTAKNKLFVNLLNNQIMFDCPAVQPLLARATLNDNDLIRIFDVYNHCRPTEGMTKVPTLAVKSRTYVSAGFGLSWHRSSLAIQRTYWVPLDAVLHPDRLLVPRPTFYLVVTSTGFSERFSLQTGLSFINEVFRHSFVEEDTGGSGQVMAIADMWLQMSSLRLPVMLRYSLPGFRARPYVAVGPSLLFPLRYKSSYTLEKRQDNLINSFRYPFFIPYSPAWSVSGSVGLKIPLTKNWSGLIEGRYEYSIAGIAQFDNINSTPRISRLTSLPKAPYQSFQLSFGIQFR